jgi:tetratricopeptide (TPR) repeat protein
MRPDEPLDRGRLEPLLDAGDWGEAEELLRALLDGDPQDLSARCQLATLLALRGWEDDPARHEEAVQLYDACVVQGWAPELCRNNQGVVWALKGQAMPAASALVQAATAGDGYGPALYNLGIVCQSVHESGGGVPQMLVTHGVLGAEEGPRDASRRHFRTALGVAQWTAHEAAPAGAGARADQPTPRLLKPLYLWTDDLSPSLGWVRNLAEAHYQAAEQHLEDGLKLLADGEFEQAIHHFQSAVGVVPEFGPRIEPYRVEAVLGLATALRNRMRDLWRGDRFDEARTVLDTLLATLPNLPDRTLGLHMIADEVGHLSAELQARIPGSDRGRLQQLLDSAGYLLERYRENHDEVRRWADEREAGGGPRPAWTSVREPQQLLLEARARGEGALRHEAFQLVDGRSDDDLPEVLTLAGSGWLGEEALRRLRRDTYHRLTQRRLVDAQGPSLSKAERIEGLISARAAAEETGEERLVAEVEDQLHAIPGLVAEADGPIRSAFEAGDDVQVLEIYAARTLEAQPTSELRAIRNAAYKRQKEALNRAIGVDWRAAYQIAGRLVRLEPSNEQMADQLERARQGHIGELISRAEIELRSNDLDQAAAFLEDARQVDAASDAVLHFSHRLDAARVRAAGEPAKDAYDDASRAFGTAEAADDAVAAIPAFLEMRGYFPDAPRTREAAAWLLTALLRALDRRELTAEVLADLSEQLDLLLKLESERADARELRNRLLRSDADVEEEARRRVERRMQAVESSISRADEATAAEPPDYAGALQALAETREYQPDRDQRVRIAEVRDRSLRMLEVRFRELIGPSGSGTPAAAREVIDTVRPWDAALAASMEQRLEALLVQSAPTDSEAEAPPPLPPLHRRLWAALRRRFPRRP